ncbi:NADH-quinone oxidoreductase subunit J [Candidatus Providencia siddallii]|uniref:NADH-quinone oxidoreductase subunit J n=1 Tax=Candidatus Providencia siddallii TaxID=1715285 RepID=A0ABP1CF31_9GAMM
MKYSFYISGFISIFVTFMIIINTNPIYALLYLLISLLSLSVVFFSLGAYFAGVMETIIYAGAIVVLFIFVVMMLNLGKSIKKQKNIYVKSKNWIIFTIISIILLIILIYGINSFPFEERNICNIITIKEIGMSLFGPYILIIEFISFLLLAGLIVAFHIGSNYKKNDINIKK